MTEGIANVKNWQFSFTFDMHKMFYKDWLGWSKIMNYQVYHKQQEWKSSVPSIFKDILALKYHSSSIDGVVINRGLGGTDLSPIPLSIKSDYYVLYANGLQKITAVLCSNWFLMHFQFTALHSVLVTVPKKSVDIQNRFSYVKFLQIYLSSQRNQLLISFIFLAGTRELRI